MRLLVFLIMPIIASADEPVDLIAALEEAAATPKTYHAMCAAAYALLAADASGNRPYQAQLDTYAVEHGKKTDFEDAALMADIFSTLLEENRTSSTDLKSLADKCEL